jgi:DNA-binding transcriptional regulator YhcF (GntR family)
MSKAQERSKRHLAADLGISRDAKARGLKALEQADLINVIRESGKAARIQLTNNKQEVKTTETRGLHQKTQKLEPAANRLE